MTALAYMIFYIKVFKCPLSLSPLPSQSLTPCPLSLSPPCLSALSVFWYQLNTNTYTYTYTVVDLSYYVK